VVVALVILLPIFKNQAGEDFVRSGHHWQQSRNLSTALTDPFIQTLSRTRLLLTPYVAIELQETKDLNLFCLPESQCNRT